MFPPEPELKKVNPRKSESSFVPLYLPKPYLASSAPKLSTGYLPDFTGRDFHPTILCTPNWHMYVLVVFYTVDLRTILSLACWHIGNMTTDQLAQLLVQIGKLRDGSDLEDGQEQDSKEFFHDCPPPRRGRTFSHFIISYRTPFRKGFGEKVGVAEVGPAEMISRSQEGFLDIRRRRG